MRGRPEIPESMHIRRGLEEYDEERGLEARVSPQPSSNGAPTQAYLSSTSLFDELSGDYEISGSLSPEQVNQVAQIGSRLFGPYHRKEMQVIKEELRQINLPPQDIKSVLGFFFGNGVPQGYSIIHDSPAKQTYFISNDITDYLLKHFGEDVDLSDHQKAIHLLRDNPNIACEELFNGRLIIAKLEKNFSGKPIDPHLTQGVYRDRPKDSSHYHEHMAEQFMKGVD